MIDLLTEQVRRLFGASESYGTAPHGAEAASAASAPPPRSFCIVVNPNDAERRLIIGVLDETGVRFEEASDPEALSALIRRRMPDMVIYGFSNDADVASGLDAIERSKFTGLVLPVLADRSGPAAQALRRSTRRVLPSLMSPVSPEALHRVVEEQGLARNPSGHVAVSLSTALDHNWLEFWYQPKIDLSRRILVGAQLLARVRHPVHGVLEPAAFIGHATQKDLRLLAHASIRTALRDWSVFVRAGFNLICAVTIPGAVLNAAELTEIIRLERPPSPRWPGLNFEISAADALHDPHGLADFAAAAHNANVHLTLTDFGNDDISRAALPVAPWAEIKMRPELVRSSTSDDQRAADCGAAIECARCTYAQIVATGLETGADLSYATAIGCEIGQGRVLAAPLDLTNFLRLLERRRHRRPSEETARPRIFRDHDSRVVRR